LKWLRREGRQNSCETKLRDRLTKFDSRGNFCSRTWKKLRRRKKEWSNSLLRSAISRNTWRRAKRYSDLRQYFPSRTYTEPSPTSTQSSAKYPGTHRRSLLENLTTLSVTPICRRSCLSCFGRPSRKVSRSGVLSRIEKRTEVITG